MPAVKWIALALAGYGAIEAGVFHTSLYSAWLNTDSSAGHLGMLLYNERKRDLIGPQVLGIGDSRMNLLPIVANRLAPETGYTFATIATPGSTPRDWYYMLRETDPGANRYAAVVFAMEDLEDAETWEDHSAREADLNYVIPYLGLRDVADFAGSYPDSALRWRAVRGILLKGTIYQQDFADFVHNPRLRVHNVRVLRRASAKWFLEIRGPAATMNDVVVDFEKHSLTASPNRSAAQIEVFRSRFLDPVAEQHGQEGAYLRRWLGKIYEHYRGSRTRLIFFRFPRGPFVRPDSPLPNPHSSVRELALRPGVLLIPETAFDTLERPALFQDHLHLNQPGSERFSVMLAREVRSILGAP